MKRPAVSSAAELTRVRASLYELMAIVQGIEVEEVSRQVALTRARRLPPDVARESALARKHT